MIKIAIVDDHSLFRQSLRFLLEQNEGLKIVAEAENGQEFLDVLAKNNGIPDIAIVDIEMPVMTGIDLNEHLQNLYPGIKVIILTMHYQERIIASLMRNGVVAFLAKNCDKEELFQTIQQVFDHGFYINKYILDILKNAKKLRNDNLKNALAIPVDLSKREQEILILICREFSNQEMANQLFISVRTVEGHRNNLLLKIGCRNTAGLVVFAIKYGIFDIGA
ncbi:DNA-binding response regulator [Chitinophaga caeni]|uniref:DNA-binding response regulator n=1 Tax=Chitinophaga caeni TaxID=2029983 RepID=A0A291QYB8_9BACT|nr:response regulator transcription factor [Chitinophaga caeni]ATL48863.1 DNA-binding response regulator [Chitinophaga caeni]